MPTSRRSPVPVSCHCPSPPLPPEVQIHLALDLFVLLRSNQTKSVLFFQIRFSLCDLLAMCYLIACCSVLDREFNSAQIYSMEVILGEVDLYFVQLIWAGVVGGGGGVRFGQEEILLHLSDLSSRIVSLHAAFHVE